MPFANGGEFKNANFIKKIENAQGKTIYEHPNKYKKRDVIFNDMLIDGEKGTRVLLIFRLLEKTGTVSIPNSNNNSDAYSVYTTNHGVWFGNY